jgi:hypothetical protein
LTSIAHVFVVVLLPGTIAGLAGAGSRTQVAMVVVPMAAAAAVVLGVRRSRWRRRWFEARDRGDVSPPL